MTNFASFTFDTVLFFGRSVDEYASMFNIDLNKIGGMKILDCSAGPAAFAAYSTSWGAQVIACDPLYELDVQQLQKLADKDVETVRLAQLSTRQLFDKDLRLAEERRKDMNAFLGDFSKGKTKGRYVAAQLPDLPFKDRTFDLTLCANFLFLYADTTNGGIMLDSNFDYDFHLRAMRELLRVTKGEVRVYPLNGPETARHAFLDRIMDDLQQEQIHCELVNVAHPDIKTAKVLLSCRHIDSSATSQ